MTTGRCAECGGSGHSGRYSGVRCSTCGWLKTPSPADYQRMLQDPEISADMRELHHAIREYMDKELERLLLLGIPPCDSAADTNPGGTMARKTHGDEAKAATPMDVEPPDQATAEWQGAVPPLVTDPADEIAPTPANGTYAERLARAEADVADMQRAAPVVVSINDIHAELKRIADSLERLAKRPR